MTAPRRKRKWGVPPTCFPMCVRESGASSSAKHQSNTQHQATLSAGAACFFVAPAGKRSSCKRESLVLGMLANLRLHERPKHLHSATMCSAVHQPFEDGDDTSCGPACIVAFNAKIQADYDESLAWLEVWGSQDFFYLAAQFRETVSFLTLPNFGETSGKKGSRSAKVPVEKKIQKNQRNIG